MKFLFSYSYTGKQYGSSVNGFGSMTITTAESKITPKLIFDGDNSAMGLARSSLSDDLHDIQVVPLGWFRFDE